MRKKNVNAKRGGVGCSAWLGLLIGGALRAEQVQSLLRSKIGKTISRLFRNGDVYWRLLVKGLRPKKIVVLFAPPRRSPTR